MFNEIPKNYRYGYARVSTKSQENNFSLEAQKKKIYSLRSSKKKIFDLTLDLQLIPLKNDLFFKN